MQLKELHPTLTRAEREAMAAAAGIRPEYLAQLATGFKTNPPLRLCAALVKHDCRLSLTDLAVEFTGLVLIKGYKGPNRRTGARSGAKPIPKAKPVKAKPTPRKGGKA